MKRRTYGCPVEAAVEVFGGKWKPVILWWLYQRTWRFAELRRQMPGITDKMLTHQLRELEALLDRAFHESPLPGERDRQAVHRFLVDYRLGRPALPLPPGEV